MLVKLRNLNTSMKHKDLLQVFINIMSKYKFFLIENLLCLTLILINNILFSWLGIINI